MITWSFCDPVTGLFSRKLFRGPAHSIEANTPPGSVAILGKHDPDDVRVDWESGEIVPLEEG